MANVKVFCDTQGEPIELNAWCIGMANAEFAAKFPGVKGKKYDGYSMRVARGPDGLTYLPVTRIVTYKRHPSKHECDARCMNATGRTMQCECACGGKNHGRGFFCESTDKNEGTL